VNQKTFLLDFKANLNVYCQNGRTCNQQPKDPNSLGPAIRINNIIIEKKPTTQKEDSRVIES
jgi:hypothetical protein